MQWIDIMEIIEITNKVPTDFFTKGNFVRY